MKSIYCQEHSNRYITNYCTSKQCMKTLCPQCLPYHLRSQVCDGNSIEHIQKIYQKAQKKGQKSLKQIAEQIQLLKEKRLGHLKQKFQSRHIQLNNYKESLEKVINQYFSMLENKLKESEQHLINEEKVQKTINKYEKFKIQLNQTNKNLNNYVDLTKSIKTLINFDLKSFFLNLRSETQYLYSNSKSPILTFNKDILNQLNQILSKYITIKQNTISPTVEPVLIRNATSKYSSLEDLQLSSKQNQSIKIINNRDYFNIGCQFKILHYFEQFSKKLFLIPLENNMYEIKIHTAQLNSKKKIQEFSRSVITPNGQIFLIGGRIQGDQRASNQILAVNFANNSLDIISQTIYPRQKHALCYFDNYIYIIGGQSQSNRPIKSNQRFNIQTKQSVEINACNVASAFHSVCLFNNKYIFKFGGINQKGKINNVIERYNIKRNTWDVIDPSFNTKIASKYINSFSFKPNCFAIQINQTDMLISCGTGNDLENTCIIILREENDHDYDIVEIMQNKLPTKGNFSYNPIIHNKIINIIQNRGGLKYGVLITDGKKWQSII